MKENSKSIARRVSDSRFVRNYFRGNGVDIGGAPDPLLLYKEFFPLMEDVRTWDLDDGDAQFMEGVADHTFDFVFSSHCLEHINDPYEGLRNWLRVCKPDGHLVIAMPDEDLYEQGVFPSTYNGDHKNTFSMWKPKGWSWSESSINILDLVTSLGEAAAIEKVELLNSTYRFDLPRYDQTLTPVGESGFEIIIRKRGVDELAARGLRGQRPQPSKEMRIHLNQYLDDQKTLRANNKNQVPFENDSDLLG